MQSRVGDYFSVRLTGEELTFELVAEMALVLIDISVGSRIYSVRGRATTGDTRN